MSVGAGQDDPWVGGCGIKLLLDVVFIISFVRPSKVKNFDEFPHFLDFGRFDIVVPTYVLIPLRSTIIS